MRSDADIATDLENALRSIAGLDPATIAVAVSGGVVTLTGYVRTLLEKWEAEEAAKKVAGVYAVANDIEVRLPTGDERPDPEIVQDALHALFLELPDAADTIRVVARNGLVRLEGEVETPTERRHASRIVHAIRGVKGVMNALVVRGTAKPAAGPAHDPADADSSRVANRVKQRRPSKMERTMSSPLRAEEAQTDAMNANLADNWWAVALRGVAALLFGIVACAMPVATLLSLAVLFAAFCFVDGIFGIVSAVRGARRGERWAWLLLSGVLSIAAGAVALFWPDITILAFVILVAAWAIITGSLMIVAAARLKVDHGRLWLILSGVASVLFGIFLIASPLTGAVVLTLWAGVHAVILGGTLLVLAYRLRAHRTGARPNLATASAA